MSRALQHKLHERIDLAVKVLNLPLSAEHTKHLAVELTPAIKALLAEQAADLTENAPVTYAVADTAVTAAVDVTEYAGCTSRVGLDVDLDSPAAALAQKLRSTQPDVIATDVPDGHTLGLTVRPQSLDCWRWWTHRLNVLDTSVRTEGDAVTAIGSHEGVTINLRGDGVPQLLTDKSAARLMGVIAGAVR